jgi:hypothetical protein
MTISPLSWSPGRRQRAATETEFLARLESCTVHVDQVLFSEGSPRPIEALSSLPREYVKRIFYAGTIGCRTLADRSRRRCRCCAPHVFYHVATCRRRRLYCTDPIEMEAVRACQLTKQAKLEPDGRRRRSLARGHGKSTNWSPSSCCAGGRTRRGQGHPTRQSNLCYAKRTRP